MKSNTKNAKGSGTIRKRSDGRWEARYTTGIDPKTGKQTQKSVYGKTQKEVRQKLTEDTAEIDAGTYREPCHRDPLRAHAAPPFAVDGDSIIHKGHAGVKYAYLHRRVIMIRIFISRRRRSFQYPRRTAGQDRRS